MAHPTRGTAATSTTSRDANFALVALSVLVLLTACANESGVPSAVDANSGDDAVRGSCVTGAVEPHPFSGDSPLAVGLDGKRFDVSATSDTLTFTIALPPSMTEPMPAPWAASVSLLVISSSDDVATVMWSAQPGSTLEAGVIATDKAGDLVADSTWNLDGASLTVEVLGLGDLAGSEVEAELAQIDPVNGTGQAICSFHL